MIFVEIILNKNEIKNIKMPGDLRKQSIVKFMKGEMEKMDLIKKGPDQVEKKVKIALAIFSYVDAYFNHIFKEFGGHPRFFRIVEEKAVEFISDEKIDMYISLKEKCANVLEKIKNVK